jgi:hypothetical protein
MDLVDGSPVVRAPGGTRPYAITAQSVDALID